MMPSRVPKMGKGVNQYWTPEMEASYKSALEIASCFAVRFFVTAILNTLKYDHRTRE